MKRLMIGAVSVIFFLGLNSSVAFAHPPGTSINIPCSVTFNGGYDGTYGHLSFLLSAPISEKLRKLHKLDETSVGRHNWRIRAKVPLTKGGDATFVATISYSVKENGRVSADTATYINLIPISSVKKEDIAAFEKKVESMKGNFGPFPSANCEVLK
jgi:hypothetical protein